MLRAGTERRAATRAGVGSAWQHAGAMVRLRLLRPAGQTFSVFGRGVRNAAGRSGDPARAPRRWTHVLAAGTPVRDPVLRAGLGAGLLRIVSPSMRLHRFSLRSGSRGILPDLQVDGLRGRLRKRSPL